jgi:hypothetical protein
MDKLTESVSHHRAKLFLWKGDFPSLTSDAISVFRGIQDSPVSRLTTATTDSVESL